MRWAAPVVISGSCMWKQEGHGGRRVCELEAEASDPIVGGNLHTLKMQENPQSFRKKGSPAHTLSLVTDFGLLTTFINIINLCGF